MLRFCGLILSVPLRIALLKYTWALIKKKMLQSGTTEISVRHLIQIKPQYL